MNEIYYSIYDDALILTRNYKDSYGIRWIEVISENYIFYTQNFKFMNDKILYKYIGVL